MKVFVGGPRAISSIDNNIVNRLKNIIKSNITILIGDANGIDKAIQQHLFEEKYTNVVIFASQGIARNNIGNWPIQYVSTAVKNKNFTYYAAKDIKMAEAADYGFMIWNGISKGTLNNILNLVKRRKKVLVYFTPDSKFYCLDEFDKVKRLSSLCSDDTVTLLRNLAELNSPSVPSHVNQTSIFDGR